MVVLHIYGDRAIFLLFYYHQDTESESCEIEMSISQPIFTHNNIKGSMVELHPYSIKWGKILWWFFVFMELELFPYCFVVINTLNLSHVKCKLV